jgi:hypothetical protein
MEDAGRARGWAGPDWAWVAGGAGMEDGCCVPADINGDMCGGRVKRLGGCVLSRSVSSDMRLASLPCPSCEGTSQRAPRAGRAEEVSSGADVTMSAFRSSSPVIWYNTTTGAKTALSVTMVLTTVPSITVNIPIPPYEQLTRHRQGTHTPILHILDTIWAVYHTPIPICG